MSNVTKLQLRATALLDLAQAIEREHQAAYSAARTALEHARRCGELLIQAKAAVPHGAWLPWLQENTTVGARQCQKYMRLARGWPEIEAKSDPGSHLTLTGALTALASPEHDEIETSTELQVSLEAIGCRLAVPATDDWTLLGTGGGETEVGPAIIVEIAPAAGDGVWLTVMAWSEVVGFKKPVRHAFLDTVLKEWLHVWPGGLAWEVGQAAIPLHRILRGEGDAA
jgi:Protein of unknown function (DUF3102)